MTTPSFPVTPVPEQLRAFILRRKKTPKVIAEETNVPLTLLDACVAGEMSSFGPLLGAILALYTRGEVLCENTPKWARDLLADMHKAGAGGFS